MSKKIYIKMPRYGFFSHYNENDLEQMNEMFQLGYDIYCECFLYRIYKLKSRGRK